MKTKNQTKNRDKERRAKKVLKGIQTGKANK